VDKTMVRISEEQIRENQEKSVELFFKKYKPQMQALESQSLLRKVRSIQPYDYVSLGQNLQKFEQYKQFCEADGTLAQLGTIPNIALDVITAAYGVSPLSVIANVQPIEDEHGTVYFKNVIAQTTKGNVTAGQKLSAGVGVADVQPEGFASDRPVGEEVAVSIVGAGQSYAYNVQNVPLRPHRVDVSVSGTNLKGTDNGNGQITGYKLYGTVDYISGAISVTIVDDIGAGQKVLVSYSIDLEGATDIPKLVSQLDSKSVHADVFALKGTMGLEMGFAMRQRFGMSLAHEVAKDLVAAINKEMMGVAINKLVNAAPSNVNYDKIAPAGISYEDHKRTWKDKLMIAEANILSQSDRGVANVVICGNQQAAVVGTLPGFVQLSDGADIGPHIFGTLDGRTVIRVPSANTLHPDKTLVMYKGPSNFEAALVQATFMPLMVTTAMPGGQNPLLNQKAAAVWSAIDVLVPNFLTSITGV
jgi:hypothetical protein